MTYSIVARDEKTGEVGGAVQSAWFGAGRTVVCAEAGIGAIASQAFGERRYGIEGIEHLRGGHSPEDALDAVRSTDPGSDLRQVGIVDSQGRTATHTGDRCVAFAGHLTGSGFTVQANMVRNDRVWGALADGFVAAEGDLAERLLGGLEAAEAAGGDARGRQSAGLVVVAAPASTPDGAPTRVHEISIDDHSAPLEELRRVLGVSRGFLALNAGRRAVARGDLDAAVARSEEASALLPADGNVAMFRGALLTALGRDEGARVLRDLTARQPGWTEVLRGYVRAGLLPLSEADLDRVLAR